MNQERVRCFVAVGEELHFTRAAQRLHLTVPAVSMAIAALEREVGARLFTRTSRHVALTEVGHRLLVEARVALAAADHWDAQARRTRTRPLDVCPSTSPFVVGLHDAALGNLTGPVLRALAAALPDRRVVTSRLRYSQHLPALRSHHVDVVLGARSVATAVSAEFWPIVEDPMVVITSCWSDLADATSLTLNEVLDRPVVQVNHRIHDPVSAAPFFLTDHRGGEEPRRGGEPVDSLADIAVQILRHDLVIAKNARAAASTTHPALSIVPLQDAPVLSLGMIALPRTSLDHDLLDHIARTWRPTPPPRCSTTGAEH